MRKITLIIVALTIIQIAKTQIATRVDMYLQDVSILNPAAINSYQDARLNFFYNRLFTGMKGSPQNVLASAFFPKPQKNIGFGLNFGQEKIGYSINYNFYINYAYSLINKENIKLHTGISAGLLTLRFNPNAIDVINTDDPVYLSLQQGKPSTKFDLRIGAMLQAGNFQLALASGRVTKPKFAYDYFNFSTDYSLRNITNIFAKHRFTLSKNFYLEPMASINLFDFGSMFTQYGANLNYNDLAWVGFHNAGNKNLSLQMGVTISNSIRIGYSYSMPYSAESKTLGGGHEFYTSWILGKSSALFQKLPDRNIASFDSSERTVDPEKPNPNNAGNTSYKIKDDTIFIGNFEQIKTLKTGYDTSKIVISPVSKDPPAEGYYVIAGVFKIEGNANKFIKHLYKKGITAYKFFSNENSYFYVYIFYSENNTDADDLKWTEELDINDVWIKKIVHKR